MNGLIGFLGGLIIFQSLLFSQVEKPEDSTSSQNLVMFKGDTMKILVAYYSRTGNTRKASQIIANTLNADVDEIMDKKSRKGILGFLRAGYDATRGNTTEITYTKDPENYDIVIIGSPVWNGRVTPAVRTYLIRNKEKMKKAAFFITCAGRPGKCLKQMRELYGGAVIAEKVILSKNIEEGAKSFAEELKKLTSSH